jgi:hypothetical protein
MPLELERSRHIAVAIPEVPISGPIALSPCQQSPQPQQPDVSRRQIVVGWRAANRSIAASASATSVSARRSSSVSTKTLAMQTPSWHDG